MAERESNIPWPTLVRRARKGAVTPFLGAGISRPPLPSSTELANQLIREYELSEGEDYPFTQSRDLMHVAQYWATMVDNQEPKAAVQRIFDRYADPTFGAEQPHMRLAELNCSVYLTTNYDNYMEQALRRCGRDPHTEVCRWSTGLQGIKSWLAENEPDFDTPVVFHLHGVISEPATMLLTEDDYLDFMVNVRRVTTSEPSLLALPPKIEEVLTQNSLLFLGYGLRDWNLRVLLRALVENVDTSSKRLGVSVQIEPEKPDVEERHRDAVVEYLEKYFKKPNLNVFWGTADAFLEKLKERDAAVPDDRQTLMR